MAAPRKPRTRKTPTPTTPDAIEIAMEAEAKNTSPHSPARQVLVEQVRLIRAQRRNENFGSGLKVLTGLAGASVAVLLAIMVWNASRADGLVIEPFSVPESLGERGITGEAVARGLMDRLSAISTTARSFEEQRQVSSDLGQGVSIQIPETGVSISQIETWLKSKLGHERRVSGEVIVRDDGTLRLIIRSGANPLADQFGAPSDLPALLQKAAEALYEQEQPGSYGTYLTQEGRWADLEAHARRRIALRSRKDKAQGYGLLGNALIRLEGDLAGAAAYRRGLIIDSNASSPARNNLSGIETRMGHAEAGYQLMLANIERLKRNGVRGTVTRDAYLQRLWAAEGSAASARGDYGRALEFTTNFANSDIVGFDANVAPLATVAIAHGNLHDIRRGWSVLDSFDLENPAQAANVRNAELQIAMAAQGWPRALAAVEGNIAGWADLADRGATRFAVRQQRAIILVRMGRLDDAEAELALTPLDCQPCVIVRGALAEARGDARTADHWFGAAVTMAPSLPRASYEWGKVLLARGDHDRAIAQFTEANRRGPRWADPLSGWGEALLAKGDANGAAKKFKAAAKLAPNWGRNEMLWGEALAAQGKTARAREHFEKARGMFLTPDEQARLTRDLAGGPR